MISQKRLQVQQTGNGGVSPYVQINGGLNFAFSQDQWFTGFNPGVSAVLGVSNISGSLRGGVGFTYNRLLSPVFDGNTYGVVLHLGFYPGFQRPNPSQHQAGSPAPAVDLTATVHRDGRELEAYSLRASLGMAIPFTETVYGALHMLEVGFLAYEKPASTVDLLFGIFTMRASVGFQW